jgi:Uncharacterized domain/protein associated with RNAses G and E
MQKITEIKHIGMTEKQKEFDTEACLLEPPDRAVVCFRVPVEWTHPQCDLHVLPGSYSFGYFWSDRNYNVYHFVLPDGKPVGLYINVACNTTITSESIDWHDLYVDLWINNEGSLVILDENEVPADFDQDLVQIIHDVIDDLTREKLKVAAEIEKQSREYLLLVNG